MALPERSLDVMPKDALYWPVDALMSSDAPALACNRPLEAIGGCARAGNGNTAPWPSVTSGLTSKYGQLVVLAVFHWFS